MGRWADRESDEQRLPEGMQRTGYDADTQQYTYRDADGSDWVGGEGNRYGRLERAGGQSQPMSPGEIEAHNQALRADSRQAWRYMLPFALIVIVFLLLLFRFLDSGSAETFTCLHPNRAQEIKSGDTCWAIAQQHGLDVDGLLKLNPTTDCGHLLAGKKLCVPS